MQSTLGKRIIIGGVHNLWAWELAYQKGNNNLNPQWIRSANIAQYSENVPTISKIGCGGYGTILWLDCIEVVRIAYNLVGLIQIVS